MKPFAAHAAWHSDGVIWLEAKAYPVSARLLPSLLQLLLTHWALPDEPDEPGEEDGDEGVDGLLLLLVEGMVVGAVSGKVTGVGLGLCRSSSFCWPPQVSRTSDRA